jgi:hypothetical protein
MLRKFFEMGRPLRFAPMVPIGLGLVASAVEGMIGEPGRGLEMPLAIRSNGAGP